MTSAMAALGIAVAATSAICYALLTRAEKIRRNRRPAGDGPADAGSTSGSDGWAAARWFGGDRSAIDSSGNPGDFSGAIAAAVTEAAAIDPIGRSGKHRGFDLT